MKVSAKDKVFLVLKYVVLGIFTVLCLYPLLWLFLSSFKTNTELYANPWGLPEQFRLDNYIQAITEGHILQYFGNSVIIAVSAVLVAVVLSSMVSYAITRMQWKLSKLTLNVFLLGMMIPVYAMVVPLFSMFNRMGLLNTHLAVIIPHIAIAFPMAIFIMTGFMGSLQYATNYVAEIAAVIITIIPSIIVYIWLHKHIMEGMVAGAVKG